MSLHIILFAPPLTFLKHQHFLFVCGHANENSKILRLTAKWNSTCWKKQKIVTGLGQSVIFLSSEVASLKNTLILLSDKPLWKPPWIMDLSWNRQNWLKLMFDSETNIPARKELIFLTQSKKKNCCFSLKWNWNTCKMH